MIRGLAVVCLIGGLVSVASNTLASPPSGVTPTVLARGTYGAFEVTPEAQGSVDFGAKSGAPLDIIVRQHDYTPGSTTGWHTHPGPAFITVTKGQVTFYEADDPNCTPHVVSAGQGYEDTGHGHIGRNETGEPAQDMSVIIAPVGGAFRSELPAPGPHCTF
ncbi:hypothetical protein GCM10022631_26970 [Deinococcus rubellus]